MQRQKYRKETHTHVNICTMVGEDLESHGNKHYSNHNRTTHARLIFNGVCDTETAELNQLIGDIIYEIIL